MLLFDPSLISRIDNFAKDSLGIPTRTLMLRAAEAVVGTVNSLVQKGNKICIFAGKGNNGGDGYAAALLLMNDYDVKVYDVFGAGQRSDEGRYYLDSFLSSGGIVDTLKLDKKTRADIESASCIIDAVFGTGFTGKLPEEAAELAKLFSSLTDVISIAIDVPLGVNASDGTVDKSACYRATTTVVLGFLKPGLVSYPAREYVGKLIYDNIGLHCDAVLSEFKPNDYYIDYELASSFIPSRTQNSNKGTFGKLLMITGSKEYPGAGHLSLEAALRSGVGYVTYLGEEAMCNSLVGKLPEAIYKPCDIHNIDSDTLNEVVTLSSKSSAILVGSGSPPTDGLFAVVDRLLSENGAPLILDAGAINVLKSANGYLISAIKNARRKVIITPHPLEFSRLLGIPLDAVTEHRLTIAKVFARENNCILVLKGAATIVTDGVKTYINSSGSSALAKAGSGDVLAGFLAGVISYTDDPLNASALSVYFHGLAGDTLAKELSEFGVIPSDLPREIARQLAKAIKST